MRAQAWGLRSVVGPFARTIGANGRKSILLHRNKSRSGLIFSAMASVLDLIGATPLVEITRMERGACRLFLKLESANPSGSIKDRPARAMIEAAENEGKLKPGGTIVEATAGNTGLGLALVAGRKGYRTLLVVPDKMAREKVLHARAMGADRK